MKFFLNPNTGEYIISDTLPDSCVEVQERPALDATWQNGQWGRNLHLLKSESCDRIDKAAGDARAKYITVTDGQEAVYQMKLDEARAYLATTNPIGTDYPHLIAEATQTGMAIGDVASLIKNTYDQWVQISAKIEGYRRGGSVAVNNATDPAGVNTALAAALTNLEGC